MTLIQLHYIVALDIHRSFVAAAESCHVSQPALTTQIKRLENELGVTLFDRSKKPVIPTEIGTKVIEQARFVLQETQKIRDTIETDKSEMSGEVKLGIIPTVAPYLIPLFVNRFSENYPQIGLTILEEKTESIIRNLKNGELDAGLIATPVQSNGIKHFPLFYEQLFVYISPNHPLSKAKEICSLELNANELLLLKEGNCFRNQMINICAAKEKGGKAVPFFYQSNSIESLKRIVDSQEALTIIPELATQSLSQEGHERVKPFSDCEPVREISLVVSRSFLKKRLIEKLIQSIRESLPVHMLKPGNRQLIHTEVSV
jgi:LysR family hydrogen peroxide-inducible transcriptional activator